MGLAAGGARCVRGGAPLVSARSHLLSICVPCLQPAEDFGTFFSAVIDAKVREFWGVPGLGWVGGGKSDPDLLRAG